MTGPAINYEIKKKKILFISYSTLNINKVKLIEKELKGHPMFEPLIVANKREPNKALVDKVIEGIQSAAWVIPILTKESIKEQWINQEIGYAKGRNISVIPIADVSILADLKGFIHKQNDIPYTFKTGNGISIREENKSFMVCFRLLIKDMENPPLIKKPVLSKKLKSASLLYPKKNQIKLNPGVKRQKIDMPTVKVGTEALSGDVCPATGLWGNKDNLGIAFILNKGNLMPLYNNKKTTWNYLAP